MRDIRDDLHERLTALDARYAGTMQDFQERCEALNLELKNALEDITRERDALAAILAVENRKMDGRSEPNQKPPTSSLSDFLITVAAARGAVKKEHLRAEADAAGYPEAKNGRAFHFVLMNITKARKLHQLPDGRYAHPNPPALSELFTPHKTEEDAIRTLM